MSAYSHEKYYSMHTQSIPKEEGKEAQLKWLWVNAKMVRPTWFFTNISAGKISHSFIYEILMILTSDKKQFKYFTGIVTCELRSLIPVFLTFTADFEGSGRIV